MENKRLRIWLYNDPSCCRLLTTDSPLYANQSVDLIVEVTKGKAFEYYYNLEAPSDYAGICGLLHPGNSVVDFSIRPNGSDFPIVFSPGANPSARSLGRALKILKSHPESPESVDVFLDIDYFKQLRGWLHGLGPLGILYDVGVTPEADIQQLAVDLSESGLLSDDAWLGLYCYDSAAVEPADNAGASGMMAELVQSLPKSGFIPCPA